jgi:hypothetical protein
MTFFLWLKFDPHLTDEQAVELAAKQGKPVILERGPAWLAVQIELEKKC